MKIRVRIAPSPTGFLHIGLARAALFNWLFAKKNGGDFILRIEDTDLERSEKKYDEDIMEALKWLGLDWDGQICRQSERLDIYEKYLKELLNSGKAFWCGHLKDELEHEQKEQIYRKEPPRHICDHKKENRSEGEIIRLAVDSDSTGVISFDDAVRGTIEWKERLIGDLSLAKGLRIPLYNFAVVVDDTDMEISHVIRGEDHISNTPKQILIYNALGKTIPIFGHLPLVLGQDKLKLSKRHGATAVNEYKKDYLPEALVNFMGFLGYTYGKEIISKEEMIREFELKKVHKSGAVFDIKKLNWINARYIKQLNNKTIKQLINLTEIPDKAIPLITERLEKLSDIKNFDYFWKESNYDLNLLSWKDFPKDKIKRSLEEVNIVIKSSVFGDKDSLRLALDDLGKKLGDRGLVYWPFRVALTGREKSPDPVEVAFVLTQEEVLKRIDTAIKKLGS